MSRQTVKRVEKPWGYELIWSHTDQYAGKLLFIKAGHRLSFQFHEKKDESIYMHSGMMQFQLEDDQGKIEEHRLFAGDAFRIRTGRKHRMIALEDCTVYEVSTPELNDVVRLDDQYGRSGTKP